MRSQLLTQNDILDVGTTQLHPLGQYGTDEIGRTFRYAKAGGAVGAGQLVVAAANVANHVGARATNSAAIGDESIQVTVGATAVTEDQYKGGLIVINAGTGLGQQFRIKGNTAAASSSTTTLYIEGAVKVALNSADSKAHLYPNKFNGVTTSATLALRRVGVAVRALANGEFGWIQTTGVAGVLVEGAAVAIADPVIPSATTAGAVEGIGTAAVTDQIVGIAVQAGTTAQYSGVDLNLE
jgi:hypothetical protein